MSELVCEAKTLLVYIKCEKCTEGLMERERNIVYPTSPPSYPHKCNKCGHKERYLTKYPTTRLIPIESLREPTEDELSR